MFNLHVCKIDVIELKNLSLEVGICAVEMSTSLEVNYRYLKPFT